MEKGKLTGAKAVIIGPMEDNIEQGRSNRKLAKSSLAELGVTVWDHYERPFVGAVEEGKDLNAVLATCRLHHFYDELSEHRSIREQDLTMIDRSDFVIAWFNTKTFSAGTMEEFFHANDLKKPLYLIWGEGKDKCPFWFFWAIPHRYIYGSFGAVRSELGRLHDGSKPLDQRRWRLMKPECR